MVAVRGIPKKFWIVALSVMLCGLTGISWARAENPEVVVHDIHFAEGAIFVGRSLYFVDYVTSDVLRLTNGKVVQVWHDDACGPNGLIESAGVLIVACYRSGAMARVTLKGQLLHSIKRDPAGQPFLHPNDLAADAAGGVYFSVSGDYGKGDGKVYYRAKDGTVKEVARELQFSNGLAVSLDGKRLYVAETDAGSLVVFPITGTGTLGAKQPFVRLTEVLQRDPPRTYGPDALRLDKHGNLFVGLYEGGGFAVLDPMGKLIKQIDLPGPHHASLAIAPDAKSVYVTTTYDGPNGTYRGEIVRVPNPVVR